MPPVPEPLFRGRYWPGLGRKPCANGRKPIPNYPGRRPGRFGTAFWSVRAKLAAKLAAKTGPANRPRKPDPETGSTIEQPKVTALLYPRRCNGPLSTHFARAPRPGHRAHPEPCLQRQADNSMVRAFVSRLTFGRLTDTWHVPYCEHNEAT